MQLEIQQHQTTNKTMTYTSFAIIGAGGLGKPILTELIARHKSVVVLARVGSDSVKALAADGVKVVPVDYTDVAAVAAVFKEHRVEVVISTIGYAALSVQKPIGDAAKKAGVKLFSPSEYGFVSEASEVALTAAKNEFAGEGILKFGNMIISHGLFLQSI